MPTSVSPQPGPSGEPRSPPVSQKGACASYPCFNNVRVFTVCVSLLLFLHGMLYEYTDGVLHHMGHRYPFSPAEQDFIMGVEKAGFIAFLLIVAFFGNRLHRPIMTGVGAVFTAGGCFLVAAPYWILGPLQYPSTTSLFLQNADCTQNNSLTVYASGTQHCAVLVSRGEGLGLPISLVCLGQFLIGTGGAFYTGLGIVHIEENAEKKTAVLLLGIALFMHGVGQFGGSLLALRMLGLPENLEDDNTHLVGIERVGAWWLGYPIIALLLLACAVVTFFFTKWFTTPHWLIRRKERVKQKVIDNRIRKLTKQQEQQQKLREERHSQDKARPKPDRKRSSSRRTRPANERGKITRTSIRSTNSSQSGSARVPMDVIRKVQKPDGGSADVPPHYKDQTSLGFGNGIVNEAMDIEEAPETILGPNGAMTNIAFEDEIDQNALNLSGVVRDSSSDDGPSDVIEVLPDLPVSQSESQDSRRKRHEKRKLQKQIKREIQNIENSQTYKRQKKYIFRSEQCKDIPRHLWRLLRNPPFITTLAGAVLGSFMYSGFMQDLPDYLQIQFYRPQETAVVTAAVCGSLGWAIGVLVGGVVMYHWRPSSLLSLRMVWAATVGCAIIQAILLAMSCPGIPVAIEVGQHRSSDVVVSEEDPLVRECNVWCDCGGIQLLPVCGEDHVTYLNPCTAGCADLHPGSRPGDYNYTRCTCVNQGYGGSATLGACSSDCIHFYLYAVFLFIAMLLYGMSVMPVVMIFLRQVVRDRYSSLSVGFSIWIIYLLGAVLAPPLYKYLQDSTCLHWDSDCHDEQACWLHDRAAYRYWLHGITILVLVLALIFYTIAHFIIAKTTTNESHDALPRQDQRQSVSSNLEVNVM